MTPANIAKMRRQGIRRVAQDRFAHYAQLLARDAEEFRLDRPDVKKLREQIAKLSALMLELCDVVEAEGTEPHQQTS